MASASTSTQANTQTGTPIFFWREWDREGYLSQWYSSPFTVPSRPGITYLTAEQYMMHSKALLFNDLDTAQQILQTSIPNEQKVLGRVVKNFDDKVWNKNRMEIVEEGTYWKFKNGADEGEFKYEGLSLKQRLLGTGDRELVEASPRDKIWGIGFGWRNAEKRRRDWGLNLLGKALMTVRGRLRAEENTEQQEN